MKSEFETWLYVNTSMNHLYIRGESQDENGAYHNESIQILWTAWQHQQSKVDELTKQLIDQGQRFNEQSQQIKDLKYRNDELKQDYSKAKLSDIQHTTLAFDVIKERDELKRRVDILTFTMNELLDDLKYPTATFEEVVGCSVNVLEQALNGGEA